MTGVVVMSNGAYIFNMSAQINLFHQIFLSNKVWNNFGTIRLTMKTYLL